MAITTKIFKDAADLWDDEYRLQSDRGLRIMSLVSINPFRLWSLMVLLLYGDVGRILTLYSVYYTLFTVYGVS
jgi:hypothetical protein